MAIRYSTIQTSGGYITSTSTTAYSNLSSYYGYNSAKDKRNIVIYRYKIQLQYYDTNRKTTTDIKNECLKSMMVDHNYDTNTMPVVYCNLRLDRSLVDDMIKNQNSNLIILSLYKYNDNNAHKVDLLSFRKQFIYFLPDNLNT